MKLLSGPEVRHVVDVKRNGSNHCMLCTQLEDRVSDTSTNLGLTNHRVVAPQS